MRPLSTITAKTATIGIEQVATFQPAIHLEWIRQRLLLALNHIDQPGQQVNIAIIDDEKMIQLHRQYCGIDSTTDVLTFPPFEQRQELDLAINIDEAVRQSAQRGHSIEQELLLYCVHGLLHCAGFDDHDEAGYQAMHAEEDRILTAIGVGVTFGNSKSLASGGGLS